MVLLGVNTTLEILLTNDRRAANNLAVGVWLTVRVTGTNVGLIVGVELLRLEDVEVDGERPSNDEEGERYDHSDASAGLIGDVTKDGWDDGTTADGGNEEGSTTLGVATEATEG